MSANPEFDAIVVGGGPAGLATAIGLRCAGFRVVVFDQRKPPIDQACGEGLMPDGMSCLRKLGVQLPAASGASFRGIRYIDGHVVAEGTFPGISGFGIRRTDLHQALVERAEAVAVDLRWRTKVLGLGTGGVETRDGPCSGRYVIAADGRGSRIRTWAGLGHPKGLASRFGVRRHYSIEPWTDFVEVHWADDCEAYVTPVGERLTGIAILWRHKKTSFDELLSSFPALEERLRGVPPASSDRGAALVTARPRTVVRKDLVLVGDASGALDPITGEGLTVAFRQALAVTDAVTAGNLGAYPAAHRRLCRKPRLLTALVLFAERRPELRRRMVRGFAADPGLFSRFLEVAVTDAPLASLGPTGLFRLLRRLAVA